MSMRKAINTKCKDCIYDPLAGGTWRQQVERCSSPHCGLYPYRPKSKPRAEVDRPAELPNRHQNGQQRVAAA